MAELVAVIASTHHPFYYRASTSTGEDRPPFADEWVRKVEAFRETLTKARPDVLVMVGSDHFHQLWLDNMPQFLVGKAPFYDANWYNEEREFGLPRMVMRGQEDLSEYVLREGLDAGFDLAFSNELRIDHSITCPIITLRPQNDLPIVPDLHQHLRSAAAAAEAVRPAGTDDPAAGRVVAVGQAGRGDRHRPPVAGAGRAAPVRAARAGPGVRPQGRRVDLDRRPRRLLRRGDAGQPAPAGQRDPRVHGLHADDGCRRRGPEGGLRRHLRPVPHHGGVLHLVPEREPEREQVPAEQVPVHRRPRPGARRALPRRSTGDGRVVGGQRGQPDPGLPPRRVVDLAARSRTTSAPHCPLTTTRSCSSWARTRS